MGPRPGPELAPRGLFPKSDRLLKRREFLRVQRRGVRHQSSAFVVIGLRSEKPRLGMAVSRKVGNAVTRNRIKRLTRETFRRVAGELPRIDYVVIARGGAAPLSERGLRAFSDKLVPALVRVERQLKKREKRRNR